MKPTLTVFVTAIIVTGLIPGLGTMGATSTEPLENAHETACPLPMGDDVLSAYQRASAIDGGCQTWGHDGQGGAVEPLTGSHVIAATIDGEVQRVDAATGKILWTLSSGRSGEQVDIVTDPDNEEAYIAWHTLKRSGSTDYFQQGGMIKIDTATGDTRWAKQDANGPLALSPDGEQIYHGRATEGVFGGYQDPSRNEASEIIFEATETGTGKVAWSNATTLPWHIHAPHDSPKTFYPPYCEAGPVDLVVHSNGTVFGAPTRTCYKVTGAIVGFSPDGEMTRVWTFPDGLNEAQMDDMGRWGPRQHDAALALHPSEHILYVVATEYVGAYHVITGDRLWAWSNWGYDDGSYAGPGPWQEGEIPGVDIAVTPSGHVLASAFYTKGKPLWEPDPVVPRLAVFDGTTGTPIMDDVLYAYFQPEKPQRALRVTFDADHVEPPFESEIVLDAGGKVAYVMYRIGDQARVHGLLLAGETPGPMWEPYRAYEEEAWPQTTERLERVSFARDISVVDDAVIVAGEGISGHAKGAFMGTLARAHTTIEDELAEAIPEETREDADIALTGAFHATPVMEGIPVAKVDASGRLHATVNLTEPGVFYVEVEGLTATETYAFQVLGKGDPVSPSDTYVSTPTVGCGKGVVPLICWDRNLPKEGCDPMGFRLNLDVRACERSGIGLCAEDVGSAWGVPGNLRDNCWTTDGQGPVTVTQADRRTGEETGAALFGPLVLTEGEYAILEAPEMDPNDPSEALEAALDYGKECLNRQPAVEHDQLEPRGDSIQLCIEVNINVAGHNTRDATDRAWEYTVRCGESPSVEEALYERCTNAPESSHPSTSGCPEGAFADMGTIRAIQRTYGAGESPPEPSLINTGTIWPWAAAVAYDSRDGQDRCDIEFAHAMGLMEYVILGDTDFVGKAEWSVFVAAEGMCKDHDGNRYEDCQHASYPVHAYLHRPGVFLPDHEGVHVAYTGERGVSEADRYVQEGLSGILKKAVSSTCSYFIKFCGIVSDTGSSLWNIYRGLFPASHDPFHNLTDVECGTGCKGWGYLVDAPTTFGHEVVMEATVCGDVDYPFAVGPRGMGFEVDWPFMNEDLRGMWYHPVEKEMLDVGLEVAYLEEGQRCP